MYINQAGGVHLNFKTNILSSVSSLSADSNTLKYLAAFIKLTDAICICSPLFPSYCLSQIVAPSK